MDTSTLRNTLNIILVEYGYKKHKQLWTRNTKDLILAVELQRSQYGNQYYINYGIIIKALKIECANNLHIYFRVHSDNVEENAEICKTLDLDNDMDDNNRVKLLNNIIQTRVLSFLINVNTENDVLKVIETYDMPLFKDVIEYFKL